MKVTIATGIYPPEIGGPATYLREVVPALKKKSWEVDIITYGAPRKGIVAISRESTFRWLSFLRATIRSARDSDVIFTTDTFSAGFPAALASWWLKKRLVTRFVGDAVWENARTLGWTDDPFELFQKKKYNFKIEFIRKIQKWVLQRSEIITVSQFLEKLLKKWDMKNITIVSNAVAPVKLSSRKSLRDKLKFNRQFVILNVGRITKYKGVDRIISMCAQLRKDIPELLLVVVGDGPALEQAKRAAKDNIISHLVLFVGKKDEKDVRSYMKAANVLVLNSEYEGMSHTLLEAMSVECPIVASDVAGNPELVKNKGLLFKYNDMDDLKKQIVQLYNKPNLKLTKKALKAITTIDEMVEKTVEVLR